MLTQTKDRHESLVHVCQVERTPERDKNPAWSYATVKPGDRCAGCGKDMWKDSQSGGGDWGVGRDVGSAGLEADNDLRALLAERWERNSHARGTRSFYLEALRLDCAEVKYVHLRVNRGTVDLYIAGSNGSTVSMAARTAVVDYLEERRPFGALLTVHLAMRIPSLNASTSLGKLPISVAVALSTIPRNSICYWTDAMNEMLVAVCVKANGENEKLLRDAGFTPEGGELVYDPEDRL